MSWIELDAETRSWRVALVILLVLSAALGAITWDGLLGDLTFFARAGDDVVSGRWGQVYDDPAVQAGPIVLLLAAGLIRIGEPITAVLGLPVLVSVAVVGTRWLRTASGLPRRPPLELVAGAATMLWEFNEGALHSGHLAQALIPALWLGAAVAARRDRTLTAGLLLAAAAGCETWGVLAVPVLLLAPRPSSWFRGGGALLGGTAVLYLPFVLGGPFRMFEFSWMVGPKSVFSHLVPGLFNAGFPWWARCAQAVLAVLACSAVVLWRRTDPIAFWAAPLAAVLVRLVLDPVDLPYYWTAAVVLLIAAVVTTSSVAGWVSALICWWQFMPAARCWSGTALVSLPGLLLILLMAAHSRPRVPRRVTQGISPGPGSGGGPVASTARS